MKRQQKYVYKIFALIPSQKCAKLNIGGDEDAKGGAKDGTRGCVVGSRIISVYNRKRSGAKGTTACGCEGLFGDAGCLGLRIEEDKCNAQETIAGGVVGLYDVVGLGDVGLFGLEKDRKFQRHNYWLWCRTIWSRKL